MINRKAVSGRAESRKPKLPRPQCDSQFSHLLLFQPQDWERSVFIPIPKKGNAKECLIYHTVVLISHTSKVILKILQVRLPTVHELRASRCSNWILKRQRNQRSYCQHPLDHQKSKSSRKTSISALLTMPSL